VCRVIFSEINFRKIWRAIKSLYNKNQEVDLIHCNLDKENAFVQGNLLSELFKPKFVLIVIKINFLQINI
jgi:hypothetical protein